jgi:hypothetical protein
MQPEISGIILFFTTQTGAGVSLQRNSPKYLWNKKSPVVANQFKGVLFSAHFVNYHRIV